MPQDNWIPVEPPIFDEPQSPSPSQELHDLQQRFTTFAQEKFSVDMEYFGASRFRAVPADLLYVSQSDIHGSVTRRYFMNPQSNPRNFSLISELVCKKGKDNTYYVASMKRNDAEWLRDVEIGMAEQENADGNAGLAPYIQFEGQDFRYNQNGQITTIVFGPKTDEGYREIALEELKKGPIDVDIHFNHRHVEYLEDEGVVRIATREEIAKAYNTPGWDVRQAEVALKRKEMIGERFIVQTVPVQIDTQKIFGDLFSEELLKDPYAARPTLDTRWQIANIREAWGIKESVEKLREETDATELP